MSLVKFFNRLIYRFNALKILKSFNNLKVKYFVFDIKTLIFNVFAFFCLMRSTSYFNK